jgi:hypothetical protein
MKKTDQHLDTFAKHIAGAVTSLIQLLRGSKLSEPEAVSQRLAARPSRRKRSRQAGSSVEWPWEKIVKTAAKLLQKQPDRHWKPGELSQAVKTVLDELRSAKGLHFGLIPRLRKLGLIASAGRGSFKARSGKAASKDVKTDRTVRSPKPAPKKKAAVTAKKRSVRRPVTRTSNRKTASETVVAKTSPAELPAYGQQPSQGDQG